MREFLTALKADFMDRRLLPFVALVVIALVGAIGYVEAGSGSGSPSTTTAAPSISSETPTSHVAISQVSPNQATAEVPTGTATQHEGVARDPFQPIAGLKPATTKTASTGTKSSAGASTGSSSSGSSSSKTGGSEPKSSGSSPTAPVKPKKQVVYHVAALFGAVPAGGATPSTQLTPFVNIPLLTPLPSAQEPLLVFRGVTTGGKSATFTVVGEVILHGNASCLPSAQQCEAIDLAVGKSELLEYIPTSGPTQIYELKIVSIDSAGASAASVQSLLRQKSSIGGELLRRNGLEAIPYLHYSSTQVGVLAFNTRTPNGARAHGARRR